MRYKSGNPKPFLAICKQILNSLNRFLFETEHGTSGNEGKIDFLRKECGGRLTSIFTKCQIPGTPEGADFNNIYLASPFLGEIVDKVFDKS